MFSSHWTDKNSESHDPLQENCENIKVFLQTETLNISIVQGNPQLLSELALRLIVHQLDSSLSDTETEIRVFMHFSDI